MRQLSIRTKLLWLISSLFLLSFTILLSTMWSLLTTKNQEIQNNTVNTLYDNATTEVSLVGQQYAEKIGAYIRQAYDVPKLISDSLAHSAATQIYPREDVENSLKGILSNNEVVSALYISFEANAYDGKDQNYIGNSSHSTQDKGTFELYLARTPEGTVQQIVVQRAGDKYLSNLNSAGIRQAEWFLCPMEQRASCLLEPYLWEVTPGYSELMTSITVPMISGGKFLGIAGVDVNLPVFQNLVQDLSGSIFDGNAKVTLLSGKDQIVASSHDKAIGEAWVNNAPQELVAKANSIATSRQVFEHGSDIFVVVPVNIDFARQHWRMIVAIPKSLALEHAILMEQDMSSAAKNLSSWLTTIGVIAVVCAVFATLLLTNTIMTPLSTIQKRIEQLSSCEGDLTQSIEIDRHAELIALAKGFNRFCNKLRRMIGDLKMVSLESDKQSQLTRQVSKDIKTRVNQQLDEIDSIVTSVTELGSTAAEVARSSEHAASRVSDVSHEVNNVDISLNNSSESVAKMANEVELARAAIAKVVDSSQDITTILDVIRSIAEQTNLLALNAAIEAARAGEQGRGFAVVADEVRALASKTQASTDDISQLIDSLKSEVAHSEQVIEKSVAHSNKAVKYTKESSRAVSNINNSLTQISNEVVQIATAAEEQSVVTEEVSRNVTGISDAASELSSLAENLESAAVDLKTQVEKGNQQLQRLIT